MLFTFPSRYWFAIGLSLVFSLAGWSRQIHAGFLVPRATQDTETQAHRFAYGALTLCGPPFQDGSARMRMCVLRSYYPRRAQARGGFGLFPGRSPLLGESLLFSLPGGTKMFQFPPLASPIEHGDDSPSDCRVVPFGYRGVTGYLLLARAFRSLSRPSSPP